MMLLIKSNGQLVVQPDIPQLKASYMQYYRLEEFDPEDTTRYTEGNIPETMSVKVRNFRWLFSYSNWSIWGEV